MVTWHKTIQNARITLAASSRKGWVRKISSRIVSSCNSLLESTGALMGAKSGKNDKVIRAALAPKHWTRAQRSPGCHWTRKAGDSSVARWTWSVHRCEKPWSAMHDTTGCRDSESPGIVRLYRSLGPQFSDTCSVLLLLWHFGRWLW